MLIPFTFCRISAHAKHFFRTTEDEICRVTRDLQYTEMMHRIWSSKLSRVCGTSSVKCTKEAASRFALMPFVHQGKILNRNNSGRIVIGPHKAENMSGPNVRNSNFFVPKNINDKITNVTTIWYPQGIQRLVSTYQSPAQSSIRNSISGE